VTNPPPERDLIPLTLLLGSYRSIIKNNPPSYSVRTQHHSSLDEYIRVVALTEDYDDDDGDLRNGRPHPEKQGAPNLTWKQNEPTELKKHRRRLNKPQIF
jgi:hypothetical protein